ncbi:MAG TPA: sulfite exporter TauE/SafE family protein [Acidocella sp.]|nr:MAG: sulfite transporter TauE/SafE [Rhodospirillales bacterium 20-64-7]HQT47005.1 sulfite exporter TauE/SafE family protein [Acidocella sp.]
MLNHSFFAHGLLWATLRTLPVRGWLVLCGALFAGGLVKGVVSIGVPLVAIPLLTGILSVKQSVLLISLPIMLGNIPQALEGGKTFATFKHIGFLLAGAMLGIAVGVKILFAIPGSLATGIAGIILVLACIVLLFSPKFTLPKRSAKPVGLVAGFLSGVMEGVSAIPGPLLATYLIATGSTGKRFTKEIALVLVVTIAVLIAMFGQSRHATSGDLLISALAAIPVVAGIIAGRPLRDALPPKAFRAIVLAFIIFASVQMILRSHIL